MDIISVMNDKALKGTKKRAAVIELIVSGSLNCEQIEAISTEINDKQMATILEAIEEISNKRLVQLSSSYLLFAIPYIKSENNNCRREASRFVGNMAAQYPDMIEEAISPLLDNTADEGTVIRRAAAYALISHHNNRPIRTKRTIRQIDRHQQQRRRQRYQKPIPQSLEKSLQGKKVTL